MPMFKKLDGTTRDTFQIGNGDLDTASDPAVGMRTTATGDIEVKESGGAWVPLANQNDFADSQFAVFNNADLTKKIAMDASGITTSTTRTITMGDFDVALIDPQFEVTVAKTGGDYATIQGAIDSISGASASNQYNVIVYPGTYFETITQKDGVNVHGLGPAGAVVIAGSSGTLVELGTGTSLLMNLTLALTGTGANFGKLINATAGTHSVQNCALIVTANNGYTTAVTISGGSFSTSNVQCIYTGLGTGDGAHTFFGLSGTCVPTIATIKLDMNVASVTSNTYILGFLSSRTGTEQFSLGTNISNVKATGTNFTGHVGFMKVTGTSDDNICQTSHIHVEALDGDTGSIAYAYDLANGATKITSTSNEIIVSGAESGHIGEVASGDLLASHFDEITTDNEGILGAGDYEFVNSPAHGDIQISGSYLNMYASAKTVGTRGADFATIQGAIDSITTASASTPFVVLVYPGVYTENIVMKNYVDIKGVGPESGNVLSISSGTGITFPDTTCAISRMTVLVTAIATPNAKALSIGSGGQHYFTNSVVVFNAINTYGTMVDISEGVLRAGSSVMAYTNSGTGGNDHIGVNIGADGALTATSSQINMTVATQDDIYGLKSVTTLAGYAVSDSVQMNIISTIASYSGDAYAIYHTGSASGFHFTTSHVRVEARGGTSTGTGTNMFVSTGGATVRGTGNAVHVIGFASNYFANIGTGCTFISHYDDANASDDIIGVGSLYRVGSTENGELRITDSLKVGSVRTGDYIEMDAGGQILLHGNARTIGVLSQKIPELGQGTCDRATVAGVKEYAFDDTVAEDSQYSFLVPLDMDLSVNPELRIFAAPRVAWSSGSDMVFRISEIRYVSFGEAWDKTADETNLSVTETVDNNRRIITVFDITLDASKMTGLDGIVGTFERLSTDGGDTRNGDALVPEVNFVYTKNTIT